MRVTAVRVYPVKSMGGVAVDSAAVEPWGLIGDRRFAVVDEAGESLTARQVHELLGFHAEPADGGGIVITDREGSSIDVEPPRDAEPIPVSHARQGTALPARGEVNEWVSKRLGRAVRLVWQPDPTRRPIAENRGGLPGDSLSLADAGPLLLVTEASMAQLNRWIAAEVALPDPAGLDPKDLSDTSPSAPSSALDIVRFRPNVVVDGDEPFAEDRWKFVRMGDVEYRTTMLCDRCVMPTIDPTTLAGGKEPIRTLARHRRWDRKVWFGIRVVPLGRGDLAVGDEAQPTSRP